MTYYSALHWAKKAEKSAEKCEQIQEDLRDSGLDLSDYAKKGEVVHNTGDETIDGVKTFNSNVNFNNTVSFVKNTTNTKDTYQDVNYIRDKSLETNNIPYNKTYYTNALMDKNNKFVTYIQNTHKADGTSTMSISARTQNANGENVTSSIGVEATKNGDVYAIAPRPTASSSMDSKQISTVGWVNDPSASLNVVHRTGDETIDGVKTFNNTILSYNPINAFNSLNKNITKGTAPTSGQEGFLTRTSDKYNTNLAGLHYTHTVENKSYLSMLVYDPTKSSGYDQAFLRLGYGGVGAYAETVKPVNTGSMDSKQISTVGWVNNPSASLNVVHRTGNEDIEGKKTFKSYQGALNVRFTGSDSMTAPSSERYNAAIRCEDKNGKNTGNFRNLFLTSGAITTDMQVCREINGTAKYATMGMRMSNTGVVSTFAPTPPTGDNSTQIATTEWVRTLINNSSDVVESGENWVKFKKGLILQWGVGDKGATRSITLSKPFATTSYNVICTSTSPDGFVYAPTVDTKTTTSFIIHCYSGASQHDTMWFAIGF